MMLDVACQAVDILYYCLLATARHRSCLQKYWLAINSNQAHLIVGGRWQSWDITRILLGCLHLRFD
jgi:hypothetical protein